MATPIAELAAETVAEFGGIVGSSIERSVGVEGIALSLERFGTEEFPGRDLSKKHREAK